MEKWQSNAGTGGWTQCSVPQWMGLQVDCSCFSPLPPEGHAFTSLRRKTLGTKTMVRIGKNHTDSERMRTGNWIYFLTSVVKWLLSLPIILVILIFYAISRCVCPFCQKELDEDSLLDHCINHHRSERRPVVRIFVTIHFCNV